MSNKREQLLQLLKAKKSQQQQSTTQASSAIASVSQNNDGQSIPPQSRIPTAEERRQRQLEQMARANIPTQSSIPQSTQTEGPPAPRQSKIYSEVDTSIDPNDLIAMYKQQQKQAQDQNAGQHGSSQYNNNNGSGGGRPGAGPAGYQHRGQHQGGQRPRQDGMNASHRPHHHQQGQRPAGYHNPGVPQREVRHTVRIENLPNNISRDTLTTSLQQISGNQLKEMIITIGESTANVSCDFHTLDGCTRVIQQVNNSFMFNSFMRLKAELYTERSQRNIHGRYLDTDALLAHNFTTKPAEAFRVDDNEHYAVGGMFFDGKTLNKYLTCDRRPISFASLYTEGSVNPPGRDTYSRPS